MLVTSCIDVGVVINRFPECAALNDLRRAPGERTGGLTLYWIHTRRRREMTGLAEQLGEARK